MLGIQTFTFNAFAENTYVVFDRQTLDCMIVDPGCYSEEEKQTLRDFIDRENLRVIRLLNTHCHLDHVFGNKFVAQTWQLTPEIHRKELILLEHFPATCRMYGIAACEPSPLPSSFLEPGMVFTLGNFQFSVLFTPGHSPGSVSFYCAQAGVVLSGDTLFFESIGRTDLPGGSHETLIKSIREQLFVLPGDTIVLSGHGEDTTIRHEQEYNPFF